MNNIIYNLEHHDKRLPDQANEIVQRAMTRLYWSNIYIISAETEVDNIAQLQWLAHYMLQQCNRVVVLASQCEYTDFIIAKSTNISHLYIDEIMNSVLSEYGGQYSGNSIFTQATFNQFNIMPEIIDHAVESIVVAMPHE